MIDMGDGGATGGAITMIQGVYELRWDWDMGRLAVLETDFCRGHSVNMYKTICPMIKYNQIFSILIRDMFSVREAMYPSRHLISLLHPQTFIPPLFIIIICKAIEPLSTIPN